MKHFTKSQKVACLAIGIFLLVSVGYVFLFMHIRDLQFRLTEIKTELSIVDALEANKLETVALLDKTKEGREEISSYFVSVEDPTPFLELVEALGADAGVTLEVETLSIDAVEAATSTEYKDNMKVALLVEGPWESLYHLVWLLEHMPYVATIADATFTLGNESSESGWGGKIELLCSAR